MARRPLVVLILGALAACSGNTPQQADMMAPEPSAGSVDEARLQRFFFIMDTDHDLSLSRPEFETGKGVVFMAIDQDNSFTLTENEMRLTHDAFMTLAGQDGAVSGQEFISAKETSFEAIDANQDHVIKYSELLAYVSNFSE